jgi:hypothetical protein
MSTALASRRFVTVAVAALAAIGAAAPAWAHSDEGVIDVVSVEPQGDGSVRYEVVLTFENDGDPVTGAVVTMVAEEPGGGVVGPVDLTPTPIDGHYEAFLVVPSAGAWTVRFTSITPEAVLEVAATPPASTSTVAVAATGSTDAPTTAAATTAAPSPTDAAPDTAAAATEAPTEATPIATQETASTTDTGGGGGDSEGNAVPIALGVVVVAIAGFGAWAWRHRRGAPGAG